VVMSETLVSLVGDRGRGWTSRLVVDRAGDHRRLAGSGRRTGRFNGGRWRSVGGMVGGDVGQLVGGLSADTSGTAGRVLVGVLVGGDVGGLEWYWLVMSETGQWSGRRGP
jgi:hypothetical protein